MRETKIIAGMALLAVAVVLGGLLWGLVRANSGSIDLSASRRIDQICGFQRECKLQLSDLVSGDWDTFYEFGTGVPQSEVDSVLGRNKAHVGDLQRLVVLMKAGEVVSHHLEEDGVEGPLNHEVEFAEEHHREQHWVALKPDTWLRVNRYTTNNPKPGGTYYVLSNTTK